jgi:hypothetical protein
LKKGPFVDAKLVEKIEKMSSGFKEADQDLVSPLDDYT